MLFYVWDPIGVNGMPSCRDEYDAYVPIVVAYLRYSYTEIGLDALLRHIVEVQMGLNTDRPRCKNQHRETLRLLLKWHDDLKQEIVANRQTAPKFPEEEDFATQLDWSRHHAQLAVA